MVGFTAVGAVVTGRWRNGSARHLYKTAPACAACHSSVAPCLMPASYTTSPLVSVMYVIRHTTMAPYDDDDDGDRDRKEDGGQVRRT